MNAASAILPPKIERTPFGLWLVRSAEGQPAYCGANASRAQEIRARMMPKPSPPALPDRPNHPHGDAGPRAAARGPLELAEIAYDYAGGRGPTGRTMVAVVRRESQGMRGLTERQRQTLEIYAATVEALTAVSCGAMVGGSGGSRSPDGGRLERAHRAIRMRRLRDALRKVYVPLVDRESTAPPEGKPITFLALIEGVALWRRSLSDVLVDHGWPRSDWRKRKLGKALRTAADVLAARKGID